MKISPLQASAQRSIFGGQITSAPRFSSTAAPAAPAA